MATVNVRELARNTSKVIDDAAKRHQPTLVTRDGKTVAAVFPIDSDAMEDWILANAPEFVEGMRLADEELRQGKTISFDTLRAADRRSAKRARAVR